VEDAGAGDFTEDTSRVPGEALGKLGACLPIERALRIQIVGAVEDTPYHVPFSESHGVIPDRVQHAAVNLSFRLGVGRARRAMPE
jgi:hypothetical protein